MLLGGRARYNVVNDSSIDKTTRVSAMRRHRERREREFL